MIPRCFSTPSGLRLELTGTGAFCCLRTGWAKAPMAWDTRARRLPPPPRPSHALGSPAQPAHSPPAARAPQGAACEAAVRGPVSARAQRRPGRRPASPADGLPFPWACLSPLTRLGRIRGVSAVLVATASRPANHSTRRGALRRCVVAGSTSEGPPPGPTGRETGRDEVVSTRIIHRPARAHSGETFFAGGGASSIIASWCRG